MLLGLATQTDDEVDAVILHHTVQASLKSEHLEARIKAAAKAGKHPVRRAA